MPGRTYFYRPCPTCGRSVRIRVDYLGKLLICQHCRGQFVASDESLGAPIPSEGVSNLPLMDRAEKLLESAERMRSASSGGTA